MTVFGEPMIQLFLAQYSGVIAGVGHVLVVLEVPRKPKLSRAGAGSIPASCGQSCASRQPYRLPWSVLGDEDLW